MSFNVEDFSANQPLEEFHQRIDAYIRSLKDVPLADGHSQAYYPGEMEKLAYFDYRDLGIFEYEGQGEHKLVEGTCVQQPANIRHREICHSDDFKVLEIVLPGTFKTVAL